MNGIHSGSPALQAATRPEDGSLNAVQVRAGALEAAALSPRPLPEGEGVIRETRSTCPYCGVGCGVIIESTDDQITGVRGDPDHPANFGRLCTKGSTLALTASASVTRQTRLLYPMQRVRRSEAPQRVSWNSAFDFAAEKFTQIARDHSPDAVGFYISGQLLTEDY